MKTALPEQRQNFAIMNEDNMLLGQAEDKIEQCYNRGYLTNTSFLDAHQQSLLRQTFRRRNVGCRLEFYGGYEDAERVVMVCLPDYLEEVPDDLLSVIRATPSPGGRPLTHRDYLGALMGLGIKREVTGDILVRDDGADIICLSEMSDYILQNFTGAGRSQLSLEAVPITDLIIPAKEVRTIRDTVASLRLDNVVSSGFGLSRSKATEAIRSGLVFVNHIEAVKADMTLNEGDLITLRHSGRIRLAEIGGRSRKDRVYITIERY